MSWEDTSAPRSEKVVGLYHYINLAGSVYSHDGHALQRVYAIFVTANQIPVVAACDSGLNTCSKPHLSSACVAQSAALQAATPVTGVSNPGSSRHFFSYKSAQLCIRLIQ